MCYAYSVHIQALTVVCTEVRIMYDVETDQLQTH